MYSISFYFIIFYCTVLYSALHRGRRGPLALGDLPVGAARGLTPREVDALLGAVGRAGARGPPRALPCAAAPELRESDVAAALAAGRGGWRAESARAAGKLY